MNFAKFFRTPFLEYTSKPLLLTFCCNSPIKKYLSDVLNIGRLLPNKRLQLSICLTLRLQFTFKYLKSQNEQELSQIFSTKPHTIFMHILSRRSRVVITNLFKNTLQSKSASMKIYSHIMEKL